jgi:hypothetical protein
MAFACFVLTMHFDKEERRMKEKEKCSKTNLFNNLVVVPMINQSSGWN